LVAGAASAAGGGSCGTGARRRLLISGECVMLSSLW